YRVSISRTKQSLFTDMHTGAPWQLHGAPSNSFRRVRKRWLVFKACIAQFDIKAERTHFLDKYVKAFRNTSFKRIITTNNGFVDLSTTSNVVRLDRKHFLQRVSCTICFQSPDLHFTEALATKLSFTAQWLLRNERVRSDRTSVDLVVNQVVQFEHINIAHSHRTVERLTGTSIIKNGLTRCFKTCIFQHRINVGFNSTVKDRSRDRNAALDLVC